MVDYRIFSAYSDIHKLDLFKTEAEARKLAEESREDHPFIGYFKIYGEGEDGGWMVVTGNSKEDLNDFAADVNKYGSKFKAPAAKTDEGLVQQFHTSGDDEKTPGMSLTDIWGNVGTGLEADGKAILHIPGVGTAAALNHKDAAEELTGKPALPPVSTRAYWWKKGGQVYLAVSPYLGHLPSYEVMSALKDKVKEMAKKAPDNILLIEGMDLSALKSKGVDIVETAIQLILHDEIGSEELISQLLKE